MSKYSIYLQLLTQVSNSNQANLPLLSPSCQQVEEAEVERVVDLD